MSAALQSSMALQSDNLQMAEDMMRIKRKHTDIKVRAETSAGCRERSRSRLAARGRLRTSLRARLLARVPRTRFQTHPDATRPRRSCRPSPTGEEPCTALTGRLDLGVMRAVAAQKELETSERLREQERAAKEEAQAELRTLRQFLKEEDERIGNLSSEKASVRGPARAVRLAPRPTCCRTEPSEAGGRGLVGSLVPIPRASSDDSLAGNLTRGSYATLAHMRGGRVVSAASVVRPKHLLLHL